MTNRIHLCQTCARDSPLVAGEVTRGARLSAAFLSVLEQAPISGQENIRESLSIRRVPCLGGCLSPCNVSFRAPGKSSLRFSHLDEGSALDLLQFATLYVNSQDGDIDITNWPRGLVDKLSARTPPPAKT